MWLTGLRAATNSPACITGLDSSVFQQLPSGTLVIHLEHQLTNQLVSPDWVHLCFSNFPQVRVWSALCPTPRAWCKRGRRWWPPARQPTLATRSSWWSCCAAWGCASKAPRNCWTPSQDSAVAALPMWVSFSAGGGGGDDDTLRCGWLVVFQIKRN